MASGRINLGISRIDDRPIADALVLRMLQECVFLSVAYSLYTASHPPYITSGIPMSYSAAFFEPELIEEPQGNIVFAGEKRARHLRSLLYSRVYVVAYLCEGG